MMTNVFLLSITAQEPTLPLSLDERTNAESGDTITRGCHHSQTPETSYGGPCVRAYKKCKCSNIFFSHSLLLINTMH